MIFNHQVLHNELSAKKLADRLTYDDADGWTYHAHQIKNSQWYTVEVRDDEGILVGNIFEMPHPAV